MSTQFATPGQELTGNVGQDQDAQFQAALAAALKEQEIAEATRSGSGATGITEADLQAVLAKLQGAQPAQPTTPSKIKLFGQEYDTPEAAEAAIQNALAQAKQASAQPANPAAPPQGFSEDEFKKFLDRPNGTPEALDYALRHTPLFKELEYLRAQTAALKMADTARQVKELVPGFQPKNQQEVATLTNIVSQLGMAPDNPAAWEAAIALADRRGLIKLEQPKPAPTRPATPPPFFGAGSEAPSPQDEEILQQLWSLSPERIEQLYNSQRR